jgi:AcrR family transcriptional regulator
VFAVVRAFTPAEKELIRNSLLEQGRELFGRHGLRKVGIKELADAAGIAPGSFYKFFPSKEELYFAIIEEDEAKIKKEMLGFLLRQERITPAVFKEFLRRALATAEQYPLIMRLYDGADYRLLLRRLPAAKIERHIHKDAEGLLPLVEHWQTQGVMVKADPRAVSGLLRLFFLATLHQQEIGEEDYPRTMDLFMDLLAGGLIREDKGESTDEPAD